MRMRAVDQLPAPVRVDGRLLRGELTATVTEIASQPQEYAGPMTMKHVGLEEKTGEIRFHISGSELNAVLSVVGVLCGYGGRLSDAFDGTLRCADREAVRLKLWVG
jgi:hypothetical protein